MAEEVLPPAKRRRVVKEEEEGREREEGKAHLLSLSDDVLLGVLGFLSSWDLLQVSEASNRLRDVAMDRSLCRSVCWLGHPQTLAWLKQRLNLLHAKTHTLGIEGLLRTRGTVENLSEALFEDVTTRAPNLTALSLHHCYVNAEKITFQLFPKTITHLSLEGCEFHNLPGDRSFFKHIDTFMPHIEKLNLTRCGWVKNHCLMALCKLEHLRVLNLRGCHRVGECFAYTALATRFGFNKVEVFDLRDTDIGDTEVQCFGRKVAVLELLLGGERGEKITDRGILSLISTSGVPVFHSKLQKLVMARTSVTDKSLELLASKLPSLRHLDVRASQVTCAGVAEFQELRSACVLLAEPSQPSE